MGLFSKLLGDIVGAVNDAVSQAAESTKTSNDGYQTTSDGYYQNTSTKTTSGSGNIYASIPAEENQYNYNGTYTAYFESIFREELGGYSMEKTFPSGDRRVVYTFSNGAAKVLVVELMTEKCSAEKLRSDCQKEGVPYLRFYYDHQGWWNIRTYVVERIRKALKK